MKILLVTNRITQIIMDMASHDLTNTVVNVVGCGLTAVHRHGPESAKAVPDMARGATCGHQKRLYHLEMAGDGR